MKTMHISKSVLAFVLLTHVMPVQAYHTAMHEELSRVAIDFSGNLFKVLPAFGLRTVKDIIANGEDEKGVEGWIRFGVVSEDDTFSEHFARYRNHFYDPINQNGFGGILWTDSGFLSGDPSPNWAYAPDQYYSYPKACQYFYDGLTKPTKAERDKSLALMFRSLGQIIHLVQDSAQPQHTRNDGHGIPGSLYEDYTEKHRKAVVANNAPAAGAPVPAFATGRDYFYNASNSGMSQYSNKNFVTAGTNFVGSIQAILPATRYASPRPGAVTETLITDLPVSTEIKSACASTDVCTMKFIASTADMGETVGRASTFSIFADDLDTFSPPIDVQYPNIKANGQDPRFGFNRFNFDAIHPFLVPRAITYSAGMLDHFFRGKMEISLPGDGVFSILDHADPVASAKDSGGFTKVKLRLKNKTPDGAGGIVPMDASGKLVAVAKFHRNRCYNPTLSGEYQSQNDSGGLNDVNYCRLPDEEIVVSAEVNATANLNTDDGSEFSFSFNPPIPINSSDMFLQVVYRGKLGDEAEAVVVETKDISEPTYVYNFPRWDQYKYNGYYPYTDLGTVPYEQWCTGSDSPAFATIADCNVHMGLYYKVKYTLANAQPPLGYDPIDSEFEQEGADGNLNLYDISMEPPILPLYATRTPVGSLARIALLVDVDQTPIRLTSIREYFNREIRDDPDANYSSRFGWTSYISSFVPTIAQKNPETDLLIPSVTYLPGRGVYLPASVNHLLLDGPLDPPLTLIRSEINF